MRNSRSALPVWYSAPRYLRFMTSTLIWGFFVTMGGLELFFLGRILVEGHAAHESVLLATAVCVMALPLLPLAILGRAKYLYSIGITDERITKVLGTKKVSLDWAEVQEIRERDGGRKIVLLDAFGKISITVHVHLEHIEELRDCIYARTTHARDFKRSNFRFARQQLKGLIILVLILAPVAIVNVVQGSWVGPILLFIFLGIFLVVYPWTPAELELFDRYLEIRSPRSTRRIEYDTVDHIESDIAEIDVDTGYGTFPERSPTVHLHLVSGEEVPIRGLKEGIKAFHESLNRRLGNRPSN